MAGGLQAEVTGLLEEIRAGKAEAKNQLVELVYAELRGLASGLMRRERAGHTLQPTALVHEACLRLLTPEALGVARNRASTPFLSVFTKGSSHVCRSCRNPWGSRADGVAGRSGHLAGELRDWLSE